MSRASDCKWEPVDEALIEANYLGGGGLHFMSTYGCIYHIFHLLCLGVKAGRGNGRTVHCPMGMAFSIACTPQEAGPTYQHMYQRWCEANTASGEPYDTLRRKLHDLLTLKTEHGIVFNPRFLGACQAAAHELSRGTQNPAGKSNGPVDMDRLVRLAQAAFVHWWTRYGTGEDLEYKLNDFKIVNLNYRPMDLWLGARSNSWPLQHYSTVGRSIDEAGESQSSVPGGQRVDAGELVPRGMASIGNSAVQIDLDGFNPSLRNAPSSQSRAPEKLTEIPPTFATYAQKMVQMQTVSRDDIPVKRLNEPRRPPPDHQLQTSSSNNILNVEEARRVNRQASSAPVDLRRQPLGLEIIERPSRE
ncbi:MAG: hypothetical protein M1821_001583 [Bathelium mastoideum]|nr:MAG: hypothetical protein M1821_001583 [Bathelium mastoideum]KAI9691469.1 MAG: hypothetical protein M1822_007540 [Bathelium mastoideum]